MPVFPMRATAHLLKRHLANVLTYITHCITNAVAEGLQQQDPAYEEDGPCVSEHRALCDGELLLLWRARPLPTLKLGERKSFASVGMQASDELPSQLVDSVSEATYRTSKYIVILLNRKPTER